MQPEIVVVDGPAALARTVALRIARVIEAAVAERDWCWLALPGGSFVGPIYDELKTLSLPWSEVEFYFTDERCVPPHHPASSYGEAADRLFSNPRISSHQVHRIEAERPDHEQAADRYAEELPEAFDLMLVEMGLDGHVAGLFPGSPALDESERAAVAVEVPQKPRRRITLTPPVFREAEHLLVVASGREKAAMVARALGEEGDLHQVPARIARRGTWVLDRCAASELPSGTAAGAPKRV